VLPEKQQQQLFPLASSLLMFSLAAARDDDTVSVSCHDRTMHTAMLTMVRTTRSVAAVACSSELLSGEAICAILEGQVSDEICQGGALSQTMIFQRIVCV
jgi:hypothetical protein